MQCTSGSQRPQHLSSEGNKMGKPSATRELRRLASLGTGLGCACASSICSGHDDSTQASYAEGSQARAKWKSEHQSSQMAGEPSCYDAQLSAEDGVRLKVYDLRATPMCHKLKADQNLSRWTLSTSVHSTRPSHKSSSRVAASALPWA